jgi:hypothetical protein
LLAALTVLLGIFAPPAFFFNYAVADVACFFLWYRRLLCVRTVAPFRSARLLAGATPLGCSILILAVLRCFADKEVRASPVYQVEFLIAWGAAMIWVQLLASLIGLDCLEHGLERRNWAAVWGGVGLAVGSTLAVAGGNIGQGPTEATTLGPVFLAVGGLLALWALFAVVTGNTASVTVERDRPSGLRLAGLLIAWGLILGRSVAGDWVSLQATLRDFRREGLYPGLVLLVFAIAVEFLERPSRRRPFPPLSRAGIIPSALFLVLALLWLRWLGPWSGAAFAEKP